MGLRDFFKRQEFEHAAEKEIIRDLRQGYGMFPAENLEFLRGFRGQFSASYSSKQSILNKKIKSADKSYAKKQDYQKHDDDLSVYLLELLDSANLELRSVLREITLSEERMHWGLIGSRLGYTLAEILLIIEIGFTSEPIKRSHIRKTMFFEEFTDKWIQTAIILKELSGYGRHDTLRMHVANLLFSVAEKHKDVPGFPLAFVKGLGTQVAHR